MENDTPIVPVPPKTPDAPKAKAKEALPTDAVTLVDKDGNESFTTKLFYDKQKDSFELAGLTIKK